MLNKGNPSALGEYLDGSHEEIERRQRDVDWEVVDIANRSRLKKERANARPALSRLMNGVSSSLVEDRSIAVTSLKDCEEKLYAVFVVFRTACDSYQDALLEEVDIEESAVYLRQLETRRLSITD